MNARSIAAFGRRQGAIDATSKKFVCSLDVPGRNVRSGGVFERRRRPAARKAHCAGGRQRRLCKIAACDGGQRRRPDRADPAGCRLRRDRRPRSRWRHAAQEFPRLHQQGGSLGAGHGGDGLSRGVWAAIGGRQLFRAGQFRDQPRHRCSDRGVAGRRLHPATRLAAAEGRHRRAGRGAAAAFRRRADRKRARTGGGRSAHADRVQRGTGHGGAGRAGTVRHLRPVAGRDDPDRRIAAAGGFQSPAASRQRSQQRRTDALGQPEGRRALHVFRARAGCAGDRRRRIRSPPSATSRSAISACRKPTPRRWSATRCKATRISSALTPAIRWQSG